jgi:hypothetical protein
MRVDFFNEKSKLVVENTLKRSKPQKGIGNHGNQKYPEGEKSKRDSASFFG